MPKKSLVALMLLAGLGTPGVAQAATASPAAAGNIQLAWVDGKVRISWTENAGIPNTIALEVPGKARKALGTTTAAGANQLVVEPSALEPSHDPASAARIVISDPSTAEAKSAAFDRYTRGTTGWAPVMVGGGVLSWAFAPDGAVDGTPDDPLDVTTAPRFIPRLKLLNASGGTGDCREVNLPATTTPYGDVPNQAGPYNLAMYSANEWGESRIAEQRVRTSAVAFSAPASSRLGDPITMTGSIHLNGVKENAAGVCEDIVDGTAKGGIEILLHARNSSTSAWYVVGSTRTNAQGNYSFTLNNPGRRKYRTVLPAQAAGGVAEYQGISIQKTVRATTKVVEAKFISPTIMIGQQPNAYLRVEPAGSQQAALQFKNASGVWQGLMYKTLSSGRGLTGPFNFNKLGETQFRWWVPASTSSTGLAVDAVYSNTFTLYVL